MVRDQIKTERKKMKKEKSWKLEHGLQISSLFMETIIFVFFPRFLFQEIYTKRERGNVYIYIYFFVQIQTVSIDI